MRGALSLTLLLGPATPLPAQGVSPDSLRAPDSYLVMERLAPATRTITSIDPVEWLRIRGELRPVEGSELTAGGQSASWRRVAPDENGWLADPALRGGYAFAELDCDEDRILLLDGRGYRHLFVNGEPRGGDVYNLGWVQLPVQLHAGTNELLIRGGRGRFRLELAPAPADVFLQDRDLTLPDAVRGDPGPLWGGVVLTNATPAPQTGLLLASVDGEGKFLATELPDLPPLCTRKVAMQLGPCKVLVEDRIPLRLELRHRNGQVLSSLETSLHVKAPGERHVRTFRSEIDGSVQYYAVSPRAEGGDDSVPPALILSLHGAGVEARGQAACYAPKDWAVVVAPTNRRPYGFDWEDWGRLDVLEVLADARRRDRTDPARTYLTGHSMGGHGTWIVGAQFPDQFAAIAPSAGWRDFESYVGTADAAAELEGVDAILHRAGNASRTLLLQENYLHGGVYVLHGSADDNVPVSEARGMRELLGKFHPNFAYHERPGAGHWWGNRCVDWPPLMDFLRANQQPAPARVHDVQFTTVNPAISARCDWLTIEAQIRSLEPSRIQATLDLVQRQVAVTTRNISRFSVDLQPFFAPDESGVAPVSPGETWTFVINAGNPLTVADEGKARRLFARLSQADDWSLTTTPLAPWYKGPHRAGPFKEVFRHRVVLVYGTQGTPEENRWSFARARFDLETFHYRGNGSMEIVADTAFDPRLHEDRGVMLYGTAETNAAFSLLGQNPLFEVRRGSVRVGDVVREGDDLVCVAILPRSDSDVALVGMIMPSGAAGRRLADTLPYFVSGVGFPDWLVLSADVMLRGDPGILGAGFLRSDWAPDSDQQAWRAP